MHYVVPELPRTLGPAWAQEWQEEEEEVIQVLCRWHLQMEALIGPGVREWRGLGRKLLEHMEPRDWRVVQLQLQPMRFQGWARMLT